MHSDHWLYHRAVRCTVHIHRAALRHGSPADCRLYYLCTCMAPHADHELAFVAGPVHGLRRDSWRATHGGRGKRAPMEASSCGIHSDVVFVLSRISPAPPRHIYSST